MATQGARALHHDHTRERRPATHGAQDRRDQTGRIEGETVHVDRGGRSSIARIALPPGIAESARRRSGSTPTGGWKVAPLIAPNSCSRQGRRAQEDASPAAYPHLPAGPCAGRPGRPARDGTEEEGARGKRGHLTRQAPAKRAPRRRPETWPATPACGQQERDCAPDERSWGGRSSSGHRGRAGRRLWQPSATVPHRDGGCGRRARRRRQCPPQQAGPHDGLRVVADQGDKRRSADAAPVDTGCRARRVPTAGPDPRPARLLDQLQAGEVLEHRAAES